MHRQSGPALLCAGQWTKKIFYIIENEPDDLCVRCGAAPEHLMHRLWDCSCNAPYRAVLNATVPGARRFPASLPPTTARTGIAPKGWDLLRRDEYAALLNYLWCVTADATTVLARDFRDLPKCLPFAYDAEQAARSMRTPFVVSSAPMPLPRRLRDPKSALTADAFRSDEHLGFMIYTDGSFSKSDDGTVTAGWGCYIVCPDKTAVSLCGPIVIRGSLAPDQFVFKVSNNVAEVVAIFYALRFILSLRDQPRCSIIFDSKYAAFTIRQVWRPRSNLTLIRNTCALAAQAAQQTVLEWHWVRGHSNRRQRMCR